MEEFARQFGLDGHLLASQAVNFFIVLVVLRLFVYKPVATLLRERKTRIEEGLTKAEEADRRLVEVQEIVKDRVQEAERGASALVRAAETRAKEREAVLLESSRQKGEVLLREAVQSIEMERQKARDEVHREAQELMRAALAKTVDMNPDAIDKTLIQKALASVTRAV